MVDRHIDNASGSVKTGSINRDKKISLYIPAYNAGRYLDRVLTCLSELTYQPDEIFVINDGSQDNSSEIAKAHGVKVFDQPQNMGLAEARNRALKEARNDWIACIDSDVCVEPDWLENLVAFQCANPEVVAIGGRMDEMHLVTVADNWRKEHMAQHWGEDVRFDIPFIFGANGLYDKRVLLEIGGFNPKLRTNGEDSDICARLIAAGYKIAYAPSARCLHMKRDTYLSLLRGYWNWMRHPICVTWPIDNFRSLYRFTLRRIKHHIQVNLLPDLRAGKFEFLGLNISILFYSFFKEVNAYLTRKTGDKDA